MRSALRFTLALLGAVTLSTAGRAEERPQNVVDYTLRARLDEATHTVHGEGTIVWRNTQKMAVKELWVHLYLNAFKNETSAFLSEPVGQFRGGGLPRDWGHIDVHKMVWEGQDLWKDVELRREDETDETDARVPLPRLVSPGEAMTIEIAFDSKLPSVVERTGYEGTFHMVAQWFPKIARLERQGFVHFPFHRLAEFYADFGTYDVTLDVPESYLIGATGPVVDRKIEGGRRIERRVQSDIHDFAFTAWDGFEARQEEIAGVKVTALFPRGFRVDAERELAAVRFALPHFNARYGAYPYPVLTVMHPPTSAPEAGGMEYPTFITTGGPWFGPPGVRAIEAVTVHELGHQWFYGLLASNEALWPFMDEGLNSYAEQEALGTWLGPRSGVDLFGLELSNTAVHAFVARAVGHNEPIAQPAWSFLSGRDYGGLVYSRTATLLETLRRVHGDAWLDAFGRYTRTYRFGHPRPDDLVSAIGQDLGDETARVLSDALFERGWIDFTVEGLSSRKVHEPAGLRDGKIVPVGSGETGEWEGSVLVARRGTLILPVEIELVYESGWRERRVWDAHEPMTRLPYKNGSKLVSALVDPDHRILLDDDYTNNFASAPGESASTRRSLERVTYWGELLATLLGP